MMPNGGGNAAREPSGEWAAASGQRRVGSGEWAAVIQEASAAVGRYGRGQSDGVPVSSALTFQRLSRVVRFRDWREVRMRRPRRSKHFAVTVSKAGSEAA